VAASVIISPGVAGRAWTEFGSLKWYML
jgi:hypothetical protein